MDACPSRVRYHLVDAKSVCRPSGFVDPWFIGGFGMNLYRGCEHGCVYCDGRAERYYVQGDFARDIQVKRNAVSLVARELARRHEPGFVFVGGGVCDAYQPAEHEYRLARGVLEVALDLGRPVHVLTKSVLVERDFDLLSRIQQRCGAVLSFSIQSTDESVREIFEPGAAPLEERWRVLQKAKSLGLGTGVMAMPVLPGISDQPEAIHRLIGRAHSVGADFVLCGGLTLRPGVQHDGYLAVLERDYPQHVEGYRRLYRARLSSGAPDPRYVARLDTRFREALAAYDMPGRMPYRIWGGKLALHAEVAVGLEHHGFFVHGGGREAVAWGRHGWALQQWAREQQRAVGRSNKEPWRRVEELFAASLADGSLARALGWSGEVALQAQKLAERGTSSARRLTSTSA